MYALSRKLKKVQNNLKIMYKYYLSQAVHQLACLTIAA